METCCSFLLLPSLYCRHPKPKCAINPGCERTATMVVNFQKKATVEHVSGLGWDELGAGEETSAAYICVFATATLPLLPSPADTSSLCLQSVSDWLKPACWGERSRLAVSHSRQSAADASMWYLWVVERGWQVKQSSTARGACVSSFT